MRDYIPKEYEEKRKKFVSHFTKDYIKNKLTKEEYVIGFGKDNKSFCYLIERELGELGGIRGANSYKFGLYYGKTKSDNKIKYRYTKKFGRSPDSAFRKIKEELYNLIDETIKLKEFKEIPSLISEMFKYKIMYVYNPKIMIPSYYKDDLIYFAERLGLKPEKTFENLQKQLMKYRDDNYPELSNYEFEKKLYGEFGRKIDKQSIKENDKQDYELNQNIRLSKIEPKDIKDGKVKKVALKRSEDGVYYYPRNSKYASIALKRANYSCENDGKHFCFIRKKDSKRYTEVHHLIPLCFHGKYDVSLDVPANIVSLCSSCHNEIHYGKDADKIIEKLYNQRKKKLEDCGIHITLEDLLNKYHSINSKS